MNRVEAVSLFKELLTLCPSFITASTVSISEEKGSWILAVTWNPDAFDRESFEKFIANRNIEAVTIGERTVFRSR